MELWDMSFDPEFPFSFTPYIYYITDTSPIHWLLLYTGHQNCLSIWNPAVHLYSIPRNLNIQKLFCIAIRLEVHTVNQLTILCFSDVAR